MKTTNTHKKAMLAATVLAAALLATNATAASVSGGALILNIDRNALIAGVMLDNFPDAPTESFPVCCRPSIYTEEFYDASAAGLTFLQLRDNNTPDLSDAISDEISALGLSFQVNDATIAANPAGRSNRSTTLAFDPSDLAGTVSGRIGFGGVIRYRVDVAPPTNRVMVGDLTLEYDTEQADALAGRSPWLLMNNISLRLSAFTLFDVNTTIDNNLLTMTGDLGLGEGFDHLGGIRDTRIGTFSLQTTVVPIPAAIWLFISACASLLPFYVRHKAVL